MSRADKGYEYIGRYYYARKLKNGKYSLYEGYWGGGENSIVGLEVVRNRQTNKPLRFDSLDAAIEWCKGK